MKECRLTAEVAESAEEPRGFSLGALRALGALGALGDLGG